MAELTVLIVNLKIVVIFFWKNFEKSNKIIYTRNN